MGTIKFQKWRNSARLGVWQERVTVLGFIWEEARGGVQTAEGGPGWKPSSLTY